MKCTRCNGLMVMADCLDIKGGPGELWIKAFRCIACGNLTDPLIQRHQASTIHAQVIPLLPRRMRRAPRTPVARLSA